MQPQTFVISPQPRGHEIAVGAECGVTEVIMRVVGDDNKSVALEGSARCAVLPSTDNVSWLSSLFSGPCLPGKRKEEKNKKDPEKSQSIVCFSFFLSKSLTWLKLVGVEP